MSTVTTAIVYRIVALFFPHKTGVVVIDVLSWLLVSLQKASKGTKVDIDLGLSPYANARK